MASLLSPDRYFSRITRIDIVHDLLSCGLTAALLDIDNTLRPRDTYELPHDVHLWLVKAREAGIALCLVSNNWHRDVYEFAHTIDLPVVGKACKPLPAGLLAGCSKLGRKRSETVVVGDQIATDVLGAHVLGMKAYLVAPLVEQDLPHVRFLHKLDQLVLQGRIPEGSYGSTPDALVSTDALASADALTSAVSLGSMPSVDIARRGASEGLLEGMYNARDYGAHTYNVRDYSAHNYGTRDYGARTYNAREKGASV